MFRMWFCCITGEMANCVAHTHDEPIEDDHCAGHGNELLGGGPGVDVGSIQVIGHERADCNLLC